MLSKTSRRICVLTSDGDSGLFKQGDWGLASRHVSGNFYVQSLAEGVGVFFEG